MQPEHGETLRGGRRLDGVPPPDRWRPARDAGGVAEGALLPAPGQRRGGTPGPAAGAVGGGEPAYGGARGGAVASAADGGGEGDGAVRDAAGPSTADRLRAAPGADRRRAGAGVPVRGDVGVFAALPRGGVPSRAAVVVVPGSGRGVRSLRRRAPGGADRQPASAGGQPRRGDARGRVQRPVPGVRGLLGIPSARLCSVSGADQGEGRAGCRLRQGERDRGPSLRELGGAGGASGMVAAGDCGPAAPRHDGGGPSRPLRPGSGEPAPLCGAAAVRPVAGPGSDGPCRLRGGGRHQRLLGAVAADRRARAGGGQRRAGACAPRAGRRCRARRASGPARAGPRPRAPGRRQRRPRPAETAAVRPQPALLRPLDEYAAVAGGSF